MSGRERERERERDSKYRQNWRLLDCAQYFENVHSVSQLVSGDFQSSRKGRSHKTRTSLATVRLRVRTRRELLPITSKTLKTTRWIFVINHSKQSLCNEQDTRHSHFLSTARMRLSTPLEGLRWRCHGVATSHVSLSMWHVTIPKYRTFLDWWCVPKMWSKMVCTLYTRREIELSPIANHRYG